MGLRVQLRIGRSAPKHVPTSLPTSWLRYTGFISRGRRDPETPRRWDTQNAVVLAVTVAAAPTPVAVTAAIWNV